MTGSKPEQPDNPPEHLYVGAINPFALVEAILGRKMDWDEAGTPFMLSNILQTDYEELFDMRFNSILYAGLRLNDRGDAAARIPAKDMHTLTTHDLVTPDFSRVEKLGDLGHLGLKDLHDIKVKHAIMSNGNLRLTLKPRTLGKTLCSSEMTTLLREMCTPFRLHDKEEWTPPNGTWADVGGCYRQDATLFSNPVQGAVGNSWLIAALMSVAWSDPGVIEHCTRRSSSSSSSSSASSPATPYKSVSTQTNIAAPAPTMPSPVPSGYYPTGNNPYYGYTATPYRPASSYAAQPAIVSSSSSPSSGQAQQTQGQNKNKDRATEECSLTVRLHSKGGAQDAPTATVTVNCELPTHKSSALPMYCRPSSVNYYCAYAPAYAPTALAQLPAWGGDMWPALYEKAFAAWLAGGGKDKDKSNSELSSNSSDHPDLTQTAHGDPVKAMAQLTDRAPAYFFSAHRHAADLLGLVRTHSFNLRTIYPTVAWTRPSDDTFRGCTLVGNMAYSVLGWAAPQERKQYVVLRHPWGITEPEGMTSYPGVVTAVDAKFWSPIELVDQEGVFAIETGAFKEYFAGMGVAK